MVLAEWELTTAIAIYAAGLSTIIAAAQLARWVLSRRSVLKVRVEEGWSSQHHAEGFTVGDERIFLALWIDVINQGERDEQVAWVFLELQEEDGSWERSSGVGGEDQVRPGHRRTYICAEHPVADQEKADFEIDRISRPYRICVLNGTGREFRSSTAGPPSK